MKYKDIIDDGGSDITGYALYSALYGDVEGLVYDVRADYLINLKELELLIFKHFGEFKIAFESQVKESCLRSIATDAEILIQLWSYPEKEINLQVKNLLTTGTTWGHGIDTDEDTDLIADIIPIVSRESYTIVNGITLYYNNKKKAKVDKFFADYDTKKYSKKEVVSGAVYFIQESSNRGLKLRGQILDVSSYQKDIIDSNYNDSFQEAYTKIQSFLSDDSGGFVLLAGPPGTGKSSFIVHLTSIADDLKRKFVLIPPSFSNVLFEPSFMSFSLEKLKDSILVIEDAEDILRSREVGSGNGAITNLLNLTDGILSKLLNIKIIATVNVKDQVDKALLRKGRLKAQYYFDNLTEEKSNNLLKKLESDQTVTEPHTLADLYNIAEQVDFDGRTVGKEPMGFKLNGK